MQTPSRGHTLDWLLFHEDYNIFQSSLVTHELTSDHHCIISQLDLSLPVLPLTMVSKRNFKSIDRLQLTQGINTYLAPINGITADELHSHLKSY